jgi:hypothetical protein
VDIYSFELEAALAAPGCPLCRTEAADERRWMESFIREGNRAAGARRRFLASGGFCAEHVSLLAECARGIEQESVITLLYLGLAEQDLARLEQLRQGRRRRRAWSGWRSGGCQACEERSAIADRKVYFFCENLERGSFRRLYARSDGLCASHMLAALAELAGGKLGLQDFLLDDWLARLRALRDGLAACDRRRDHRYALEPAAEEQLAPGRALLHYGGTTPRLLAFQAGS